MGEREVVGVVKLMRGFLVYCEQHFLVSDSGTTDTGEDMGRIGKGVC